jgi:Xaa-Pro aminopeptidase
MVKGHHALPPPPGHGFPTGEFAGRTRRIQQLMAAATLDALLLTTPQNFRYLTGYASQFWESPTRPWFLVVPLQGDPIAVIPEIGGAQMGATWLRDIRTWPAPRPEDDGLSLLADTLGALTRHSGRIGAEMGREMPMRLPLLEFQALSRALPDHQLVDASSAIWQARMVKSEAEIACIRYAALIASTAYEELHEYVRIGMTEREINSLLTRKMLAAGADAVPFLPVISGPGGVEQIVAGPGERALEAGDVLFIDTGVTYDGYFCDFDRVYAVGEVGEECRRAHDAVWCATQAAIDGLRPGMTCEELWGLMNAVLEEAGSLSNNVGRMGHGLGMQLTEPPSHMPGDKTVIEENMVLTIEPGMEYAPGKMIVHEENIVVRASGAELLSLRAPREMWVVSG